MGHCDSPFFRPHQASKKAKELLEKAKREVEKFIEKLTHEKDLNG